MRSQRLIALAAMAVIGPMGMWSGDWRQTGANRQAVLADVVPANGSMAATGIEPYDGVGNNLANPSWGSAGSDLIRLAPAAYADGIDSPSLPADLSARAISNLVNNQADPNNPAQDISTVDQNSLSDYGYALGQFIDHDMDLTPDGGASFPIPVANNDPIGPDPLDFTRSQTDPATGVSNPAQQVNVITSYLDLSQIYGSSEFVADALRTFAGGLLKTSPGNMLPYDNSTYFTDDQIAAMNMANDAQAVPEDQLFAAGDRRGNENIELTALVTLFVRNHNRIAAQFQKEHPNWTDEQLYQEARKINIAQYQNIIYSEWIPALLGSHALPPYRGYNPNVNASIANEFSTVAFRFGHSMVSPDIAREGNNGQAIEEGIPLAFDFFDPNLLNPNGVVDPLTGLVSTDIGPILKGDADGNGQAMDTMAIEDIRNFLFGNGGLGGDDLMARDVQRGRDNGIPDYNTLRVELGLPAVTSFAQITENALAPAAVIQNTADLAVTQELQAAYPGGLGTIDAFEGGLCEYPVPGSDVGPTFQAIMVDQFRRLRDGDRFFYLNENFNADETNIFQKTTTLAKVIMANTNVTNLQNAVVSFRASISGLVTVAGNARQATPAGIASGITVQLQDSSGDVLATTSTDSHGQYTFDQLGGPAANPGITPGVSATGVYDVVLVVPRGLQQTSPNPGAILISRGDTNVTGVSFSLASLTPTPPPPPVRPPGPMPMPGPGPGRPR